MSPRALSFLMLLASLAAPAADHYDPAALVEIAGERMRQGDLTTAWILLERAALLAPQDPRIQRSLREVQAARDGRPAPAEIAAPAPPAAPAVRRDAAPGAAAEPPRIWAPR